MILLPYTNLDHRVRKALSPHDVTEVYVGQVDVAYFEALKLAWQTEDEHLIVVEHDVVVNHDTIQDFLHCDSDWCCAPYKMYDWVGSTLGCTKFSKALRERHPHALEEAQALEEDNRHRRLNGGPVDGRAWQTIDTKLWRVLAPDVPCELHRQVKHLHEYNT